MMRVHYHPSKHVTARISRSKCCAIQNKNNSNHSRRLMLATIAGVTTCAQSSLADLEFTTLYGLASPPTSYGGYGGNLKETPKYKFDYPSTWRELTVNKVQKGTQGIDCIVQDGRNKQTRAFVIALGRAGEDNKSFKLTDLDSTFNSFVAADYDLQDAVATADEIVSNSREVNGQMFYDYLVPGSDSVYRATITVSGGKVFALFVSNPSRTFKEKKVTMDTMIQSFRTL